MDRCISKLYFCIRYLSDDDELFQKYWPADVHLMAMKLYVSLNYLANFINGVRLTASKKCLHMVDSDERR